MTLLVSSLDYQGNAFALEKQGCGKVWNRITSDSGYYPNILMRKPGQGSVLMGPGASGWADKLESSKETEKYGPRRLSKKHEYKTCRKSGNKSFTEERAGSWVKYSWYVKKSENWEFSIEFSNLEVVADLEKSNSGEAVAVKDDHSKLRENRR